MIGVLPLSSYKFRQRLDLAKLDSSLKKVEDARVSEVNPCCSQERPFRSWSTYYLMTTGWPTTVLGTTIAILGLWTCSIRSLSSISIPPWMS